MTLLCSRSEVAGVEHLLSALEGCGIDNARIEIEGGNEIPIIDGSALGWTLAFQQVSHSCGRSQKLQLNQPQLLHATG